jgi:hypothetical protein
MLISVEALKFISFYNVIVSSSKYKDFLVLKQQATEGMGGGLEIQFHAI